MICNLVFPLPEYVPTDYPDCQPNSLTDFFRLKERFPDAPYPDKIHQEFVEFLIEEGLSEAAINRLLKMIKDEFPFRDITYKNFSDIKREFSDVPLTVIAKRNIILFIVTIQKKKKKKKSQ